MPSEAEPHHTAALLRERRRLVIDTWLAAFRASLGTLPEGPTSAIVNDIPDVLEGLVEALEGQDFRSTAFLAHADSRHLWSAFSAEHLRREYRLLRKAIFEVLERDGTLSRRDRDVVIDYLDEGLAVGARRFDELRRFGDDLEKQYLHLIERLVAESAHIESLAASADRLLDVVRQGMRADAASLLLYQRDTLELRLASSAASSSELASLYRAGVALVSTSERTGGAPEPHVVAVDELDEDARDALEAIGIRWVVFVALPQSGWLPGTLCLGFHEKPAFDPVALRLLKVLGDRLTVFLSRVDVFEHSKVALDRARKEAAASEADRARLLSEGLQREDLAATITHDLRNPLSTAKMGTEVLKRGVVKAEQAESVANQVLRAIDRSDRMISTLLDTYRVRSGRPLQLTIENYGMNDVAEEVIRDMTLLYGDRFAVRASGPVSGFWSRDGMRRVLENLLVNAVKYGNPGAPIVVTVDEIDGKMQMAVHNEGPPLSRDEQAKILDPFERGRRDLQATGWGIGLTFVRGMVEAHGGSIGIDSSAKGGTTFTVRNPMDSRPFQGGA